MKPLYNKQVEEPLDENIIMDTCDENRDQCNDESEEEKGKRNKFEWRKIFNKLKEIILSEGEAQEKMFLIVKVVAMEIKLFLINMFMQGDMAKLFFKFING